MNVFFIFDVFLIALFHMSDVQDFAFFTEYFLYLLNTLLDIFRFYHAARFTLILPGTAAALLLLLLLVDNPARFLLPLLMLQLEHFANPPPAARQFKLVLNLK